jgi:hypothetical protein
MSTGLSSSARSSVSSIRFACPPDCLPLQDHQCLPYVLHAHRIVFLYKIISVFHTFYMPTGLSSSTRSTVSSIRFTCPPDCLPLQDRQCLPCVLLFTFTGALSGAGTAYHSGAPEFIPGF